MLAHWLMLGLAIELTLYGLLLYAPIRGGELALSEALALSAAVALGWRSALVLVSIGLAARIRRAGRHSAAAPLSARAWLRLVFAEIAAHLRGYTLALFAPFWSESRIPYRDASGAEILLVHGYLCNRGFWWPLRRRLERQGHSVHAVDLEPVLGDLDGLARRLEQRIVEIGARPVILIAHSMGGLVARRCLERAEIARCVRRLITLGTPHRGTELARYAVGRNARQMRPGSAWLRQRGAPPPDVEVVSIYSPHDNIVAPPELARLEGAENVSVNGVGHLELYFSPRAWQLVFRSCNRAATAAASDD